MTAAPGKKPEDWLGLTLTAILCLGFLYWWFRPQETQKWTHQTPAELMARALGEPRSESEPERLLLDFDLLELTILQAKLGMAPEGLEAAKPITHPVIQAHAVRQAAQAFLNSDPERLDQALTMCDVIADPDLRASMRDEVLLQIAMLGFADVVLPQAKGPVLRARMARALMETDSQAAGRTLLEELEPQLEKLPPAEAATVRRELAWARVWFSLEEGPAQAFPAIRALPAAGQRELWLDLLQVCFGRGEAAKADAEAVAVQAVAALPEIRHEMELEALQANAPLRPEAELLTELREKAEAAPAGGEEKIRALLALAAALGRSGEPETATPVLEEALALASALPDLKLRAVLLAETAGEFSGALLMSEAAAALRAAAETARAIPEKTERLPALVRVMAQAFENGDLQTAAALAEEAAKATAAAEGAALDARTLEPLVDFLTRIGDWEMALTVIQSIPDGPARAASLEKAVKITAEDCMVYDAGQPTPRGQPLDAIRELAGQNETAAAALAQAQPPGPQRARAWLAMAKGQLLPPQTAAGEGFPLGDLINDDPSAPSQEAADAETIEPRLPASAE